MSDFEVSKMLESTLSFEEHTKPNHIFFWLVKEMKDNFRKQLYIHPNLAANF